MVDALHWEHQAEIDMPLADISSSTYPQETWLSKRYLCKRHVETHNWTTRGKLRAR
jgi:hypothetical protein